MIKNNTILACFFFLSFALLGTTIIDWNPDPIPFETPKGWPKPQKIFSKNKLTEQGFQLGKKLFYDGNLSSDGEVSCASCHQQHAAFANYDHDLSHGVNNTLSFRNAPPLINVAWMKDMHWDGGINHIEVQPLAPLTNPQEMGNSIDSVIHYLQQDTAYTRMFREAFGDETINSQRMLKALAQFVGTLVSSNSKYDRVMRGEDRFTDYEERGYGLFKTHCAGCHKEPLFTDNSFRNNGQQLNRFGDAGRMKITQKREDSLKFKVPTLRNIQLTFPYTHDGHVYSLFQVIDHYRSGIDTTRTDIDPLLRRKINMTNKDRIELVYFLYTLTDSTFIRNPRFAPDRKIVPKNPHH